jgi:hypothetical protein
MQSSAGECVVDNPITHCGCFPARRGFSSLQMSEAVRQGVRRVAGEVSMRFSAGECVVVKIQLSH